jgi:hypothetical protein
MFRIGNSVDPWLLQQIVDQLMCKPLQVNKYRKNSGLGQSQVFGICRQRNGTYTGARMNFVRPKLYQSLMELGNKILPPEFNYLSIQVNQNYQTAPHYDKGNKGESAIIAFGDYTGGELIVEGTPIDIKNRLVFFDGSKCLHSTTPFMGNRFSLVFHTPDRTFTQVPTFSFTIRNYKVLLVETLSGIVRIYDALGNVIESSDNVAVEKKARIPTLRACIE